MPTYWESDNNSRHDASLELGQQPIAVVGARSAMCGMIVKVTLIAFGLVASYYGSIASTVPTPSQQGLEVAAPPRKSNEPQQAFRTKPIPTVPTAPVKRHQPRAVHCSDHIRVASESSSSPSSVDSDEELALWPQPRSVNWRGQGNTSWALAQDFHVFVAKPLPLASQPLLASASRVCGLLWRPAQYSSETTILSSIAIIVSGSSTEISRKPQIDASDRHSPEREQRASADPAYGGWLPKLRPVQDEAYTIEITSSSPVQATLKAQSVAGALNGLETFAQLFTERSPLLHAPAPLMPEQHSKSSSNDSSHRAINSGSNITSRDSTTAMQETSGNLAESPSLRIEDIPAVAWRGMMVDVARHFLPLPLLVSTLDAMRAVKLNVLHLHLTDAQSFPLLLETNSADFAARNSPGENLFSAAGPLFPTSRSEDNESEYNLKVNITEIGRLGAFPTSSNYRRHHDNNTSSVSDDVYGYTAADLSLLVREASLRGIRIVPEVDVPAHTLSWGNAYPEIVVACAHRTAEAQSPSDVPALNPSKALTYEVVFAVLAAVAKVFPDEYLHLGADEVRLPCWEEDSELMAWAKANGLSGARGLFDYFETRAIAMATQLNRTAVLWQGALDQQLALPGPYFKDRAPLAEPWKCWSNLNTAAASTAVGRGFGVIDASCWYLDWPTPWTNNLKADFVLPPQSNDASPLSAKRRLSTRNQLPVSSKRSKVKTVEVDALPLLKHPPWRQGGRAVHFARRRLAIDGDGSKAAEVTSTSQDITTENTAAPHLSTRTAPPQARREDSVPSTSAEKKPPKGELVGGETAMWTESVDWTNFECRVWPRAAAVAERLWRGAATETPEKSSERFRVLTALLQSRGVGAAPVEDAVDGSNGGQQCPPLGPHLQRPLPPLPSKLSDSKDRTSNLGSGEGSSGITAHEGSTEKATASVPNEEAADPNDVNASHILPWLFGEEDRVAPNADDNTNIDSHVDANNNEDDDDGGPIPASLVSPVSSAAVHEVTYGVSVVQLNADDGGGGSLARMAAIESWLQNMALGHTNNDTALGGAPLPFPAIAVGLCELNGWAKLDRGYLDHRGQALTPSIVSKAAAAGFAHAHIWTPPGHPYAIGVAARSPILVVHEWGPKEGFERGLLHAHLPLEPWFDGRGAVDARGEAVWPPSAQRGTVGNEQGTPARRRGLDLLIVHLAPHDSSQRLEEAHKVAGLIQRLTSEGRPALVMGDFNTLSRWDAPQHETSGLLEWISNGTAAHAAGSRSQKHFSRLARKYATEVVEDTGVAEASTAALATSSAYKKLELAYGPMDTLLNASKGGLTDLCALQCRNSRSATFTEAFAVAQDARSTFSAFTAAYDPGVQECLQRLCCATEPTLLLPDRAELPPGVAAPPIRVDFLLANDPFLEGVAGSVPPAAETLINAHTSTMSDHYPIRVQWMPKPYAEDADMQFTS